jgi:hypothetical protein
VDADTETTPKVPGEDAGVSTLESDAGESGVGETRGGGGGGGGDGSGEDAGFVSAA